MLQGCAASLLFFEVDIPQIEVSVGHARIKAKSFLVCLDGHVRFALTAIDQAQIVEAFDARRPGCRPAPQVASDQAFARTAARG